jgi:hypothetical protein
MGYKYIMNSLSQSFIISSFLTFLACIFSESISLKYHCTFSLYKVIDFTIGEFSRPSYETFYRYQLPIIWLTRHHLLLPITLFTEHHLLILGNTCTYHNYRSLRLPDTTYYYHSYWSHWFIRHHLPLPQLLVT